MGWSLGALGNLSATFCCEYLGVGTWHFGMMNGAEQKGHHQASTLSIPSRFYSIMARSFVLLRATKYSVEFGFRMMSLPHPPVPLTLASLYEHTGSASARRHPGLHAVSFLKDTESADFGRQESKPYRL